MPTPNSPSSSRPSQPPTGQNAPLRVIVGVLAILAVVTFIWMHIHLFPPENLGELLHSLLRVDLFFLVPPIRHHHVSSSVYEPEHPHYPPGPRQHPPALTSSQTERRSPALASSLPHCCFIPALEIVVRPDRACYRVEIKVSFLTFAGPALPAPEAVTPGRGSLRLSAGASPAPSDSPWMEASATP